MRISSDFYLLAVILFETSKEKKNFCRSRNFLNTQKSKIRLKIQ